MSDAGEGTVSPELEDPDQHLDEYGQAEAYGFRGSFLDLGDLVRCAALRIKHYGRTPTFVSCKDAISALRRLPKTIRAQVRELGVPGQVMAADDSDNRDYIEELGLRLIEATIDVEVVTLSVPDDLISGTRGNEDQYDYWLWALHETLVNAFERGQYLELRFVHGENYSKASLTLDVYQMHNVDAHLKRMIVGDSIHGGMRTASLRLIQSQRYPTPPSIIDNKVTLFAILHAIDRDAWVTAGYSIGFTEPHTWEGGSVLSLRLNPQTVTTLSEDCKSAASWWLDKCAFCIGNGLSGFDILHAITECRCGGRDERWWNLGQQILQNNLKTQRGCKKCAFPLAACEQQTRRGHARQPNASSQCRFGEIIYDVVVGMCQSECYFYREFLTLAMRSTTDDDPSDQDHAVWLGSPMSGMEGIEVSSSGYSFCGREPP